MDRCGALISVMCASARWAMNSCSAGVMMWSFRPMMSQDGMVVQAGVPAATVRGWRDGVVARGAEVIEPGVPAGGVQP